jgi:hypothetical protein
MFWNLQKKEKKSHRYSAQTMFNVISKYYPKESIEFPTRRNYLEHLLKTKETLFNITGEELNEEETKNKNVYIERKKESVDKMYEWVKDKKEIKVFFCRYYRRMKGEIYWDKYGEEICEIKEANKEYVVIFRSKHNQTYKFVCDPDIQYWKCGKDYIKYEL